MAVGKAALGKVEDITLAILVLRGRPVLLDAELAVLSACETARGCGLDNERAAARSGGTLET